MTYEIALRGALAALQQSQKVDEFGREPEAHWESVREMRRAFRAAQRLAPFVQ